MDAMIRPETRAITGAESLSQNPAAVYLARLTSKHSRRTMRTALQEIADLLQPNTDVLDFPWSALRYQHTGAIRATLLDRHAPATVNKMLSALRGVLKEAWRLGQMTAEDYQRAADIETVKGKTLPAGRDLQAGEIAALVRACAADDTPAGVRDAAMIGLLATGGLRRSEVVKLEVGDFDAAAGKLSIRGAKGRKDRTVYVTGGALLALQDWCELRGADPGPLFTPILKGGRMTARRMSDQAVYNLLEKRAAEAGVSRFSPHDFRRTFVGDMLDAGVDIATVAGIAGHASVNTTARYDRRPEETKRQAAAKLHYPYRRRK
jgi:integrase